jgi:hypothetical protein
MPLKYIRRASICFVMLFLTLTCATARFESGWDGNDTAGWPLTFYEFLGGKRPGPYYGRGLIVGNLIIDVLVVLALTALLLLGMNRLRRTRKMSKSGNK